MKENNTINWLDVANTYVNYKTLEGVNQLARSQHEVANQMFSVEQVKQNDNIILSQLVDVLSQTRRLLLDSQHNETILLAATGVNLYDKYYSGINNAESKLKATEIQVEFLETIKKSVLDDSIRNSLQTSLTEFFSSFKKAMGESIEQIRNNDYNLIWLNSEEWPLNIGKNLVCIRNVINRDNYELLFKKDSFYKIVNVEKEKTFVLVDEFGRERYLYLGENGNADNFAYFESTFPNMNSSIAGLELCRNSFTNEVILKNLKSVSDSMLNTYSSALEQANVTDSELDDLVNKYKTSIINIVNLCTKDIEENKIEKEKETTSTYLGIFFILVAFIIILTIIIAK